MPASYPSSIKNFTYRVDNQDKVIASDVNVSYDEIVAIETQLGTGGVASNSGWGGAFDTTTTDWSNSGGLRARLQNIENGVYRLNSSIDGGTP